MKQLPAEPTATVTLAPLCFKLLAFDGHKYTVVQKCTAPVPMCSLHRVPTAEGLTATAAGCRASQSHVQRVLLAGLHSLEEGTLKQNFSAPLSGKGGQ